jgi:GMP synthase (glutamine-hydrolysing)
MVESVPQLIGFPSRPMTTKPKKPILAVLHQAHSVTGRVGQVLHNLGYSIDICRPACGDALPETLEAHDGAVVFGGPMSANDSDEFVCREIDWMAVPLEERKPLLGICLGAQMLARQLGAKVFCHVNGEVEVGYYPVQPTEAGLAIAPNWPSRMYQWHREGFDLPPGADLLAEGETFPVQAFRYGPAAYGIQFHPEVTHAMMCRWTVRGAARLSLPGAKPRAAHFADRAAYDWSIRSWLAAFMQTWLRPLETADIAPAQPRAIAKTEMPPAPRAARAPSLLPTPA